MLVCKLNNCVGSQSGISEQGLNLRPPGLAPIALPLSYRFTAWLPLYWVTSKTWPCFFWYLKKRLVQFTLPYTCRLNKSHFTRYQKNTAMFNWSPCWCVNWITVNSWWSGREYHLFYPSIYLSFYLSIFLSIYLSMQARTCGGGHFFWYSTFCLDRVPHIVF